MRGVNIQGTTAAAAAGGVAEPVLPPPSSNDSHKLIKFNDAVGRKFSFPFDLCKRWTVSLHLVVDIPLQTLTDLSHAGHEIFDKGSISAC